MRYAAIDIGTVTTRMLVADVCGSDVIPIAREYAITNLGEGVDETHRLAPHAIERVISAIKRFLVVRDSVSTPENPILDTVVMSTSAARDAENSQAFIDALAGLGLSLKVIPGSEEAALSFKGASIGYGGQPIMVVDVGGGSTEISLGIGGEAPLISRSFDIGCRRATERYLKSDPYTESEIERTRTFISSSIATWAHNALDRFIPETMIAVAGTATSVVSMRDRMEVYDSDKVQGAVVTRGELEEILDQLARMTLSQREQVVGLDPGRAPVIVAGLLIMDEVMKAFRIDRFVASESDILQGMILLADTERAS